MKPCRLVPLHCMGELRESGACDRIWGTVCMTVPGGFAMGYQSPYEHDRPDEELPEEERGELPAESPFGGVLIPPSSDYMQQPAPGTFTTTPAPPDDIEPDDAPPKLDVPNT